MEDTHGGAFLPFVGIACQLEIFEETSDGYGLRRINCWLFHLFRKSLSLLWRFPCDIFIILLQIVLQTVCAISHSNLKFVVDRMENLESRIFLGFVVHIIAAAGLAAGATVIGVGLWIPIRRLEGSLITLAFLVFALLTFIEAWVGAWFLRFALQRASQSSD